MSLIFRSSWALIFFHVGFLTYSLAVLDALTSPRITSGDDHDRFRKNGQTFRTFERSKMDRELFERTMKTQPDEMWQLDVAEDSSISLGGAYLDEGSLKIKGGGFPGCGKAPLFRFPQTGGYIINGVPQQYGEFPQYVFIKIGDSSCGGTLISDRHVITAAHCFRLNNDPPPEDLIIILGEHNKTDVDAHETQIKASDYCISDKFDESTSRFDWALITLTESVQFTDHIQPACLPKGDQYIDTFGPISKCFLVGIGAIDSKRSEDDPSEFIYTKPDVVQKLRVVNVACKSFDFGRIDYDRVCYHKSNFGLGNSCVGDSGGPVVCLDQQNRWTLMGITSYGTDGCNPHYEGVYVRTRTLLSEVEEQCEVNLLEIDT